MGMIKATKEAKFDLPACPLPPPRGDELVLRQYAPMAEPAAAVVPANTVAYPVPPMAVYHICRVCLRPRSAKYHRENPILINCVPPPPGICKRCSKPKVVEIAEQVTSNKVNLGVSCLAPRETYITKGKLKEIEDEQLRREGKRQYIEKKEIQGKTVDPDIVYKVDRGREVSPSGSSSSDEIRSSPITLANLRSKVNSMAADLIDPNKSSASLMTSAVAHSKDHRGLLRVAPAAEPGSSNHCAYGEEKLAGQDYSLTEAAVRCIARDEIRRSMNAKNRLDSDPGHSPCGRVVPVESIASQAVEKNKGRVETDRRFSIHEICDKVSPTVSDKRTNTKTSVVQEPEGDTHETRVVVSRQTKSAGSNQAMGKEEVEVSVRDAKAASGRSTASSRTIKARVGAAPPTAEPCNKARFEIPGTLKEDNLTDIATQLKNAAAARSERTAASATRSRTKPEVITNPYTNDRYEIIGTLKEGKGLVDDDGDLMGAKDRFRKQNQTMVTEPRSESSSEQMFSRLEDPVPDQTTAMLKKEPSLDDKTVYGQTAIVAKTNEFEFDFPEKISVQKPDPKHGGYSVTTAYRRQGNGELTGKEKGIVFIDKNGKETIVDFADFDNGKPGKVKHVIPREEKTTLVTMQRRGRDDEGRDKEVDRAVQEGNIVRIRRRDAHGRESVKLIQPGDVKDELAWAPDWVHDWMKKGNANPDAEGEYLHIKRYVRPDHRDGRL
ncbi:hypothetical protein K470DRAFT_263073 [Piedraia hortae CBS 480.64]|uniref:Uncharacterized protein n=1 Tax=Piedraia hortae CBS 480.64 TaxID=1314780 RepID=A0A6A7C436_9PEZI|nr:hypothetical protein K470DRAFT_263073 [Piedraia hortae CBS 480.64]